MQLLLSTKEINFLNNSNSPPTYKLPPSLPRRSQTQPTTLKISTHPSSYPLLNFRYRILLPACLEGPGQVSLCICACVRASPCSSPCLSLSQQQQLYTYPGDGAETRELQCQHEGGSCEFFLLCWMSSGLIQGSCGGFMRGCCHRTAKSANLGSSDSNMVDLTSVKPKDYGPVINDPSESPKSPPAHLFCVLCTLSRLVCVCLLISILPTTIT